MYRRLVGEEKQQQSKGRKGFQFDVLRILSKALGFEIGHERRITSWGIPSARLDAATGGPRGSETPPATAGPPRPG